MLEDQVAEAVDRAAALGAGHRRPGARVEGGAGGLHRAVDVLGAAAGDLAQDLAGRRVVDVEGAAVGGLHPVGADQHRVLGGGEALRALVGLDLGCHDFPPRLGPAAERPGALHFPLAEARSAGVARA